MKKIIPIAVILIVVVGIALVITNKHSSDKNNANTSTMGNMGNNQPQSSVDKQDTNKVTIQNFAFAPSSIIVKKGTTVTWTNEDSVAHTVAETDGKTGPNSQDISKGQSYSFTYDTVGTFNYHCSIHPDMIGKVTVTD